MKNRISRPAQRCGHEHLFFADPAPCVLLVSEWPEQTTDELVRIFRKTWLETPQLCRIVRMDLSGWCSYSPLPPGREETGPECFRIPDEWSMQQAVTLLQNLPFRLEEGENLRIALQNLPGGVRVYLTVHHLFMDGVSILEFMKKAAGYLMEPDIRKNRGLRGKEEKTACDLAGSSLNSGTEKESRIIMPGSFHGLEMSGLRQFLLEPNETGRIIRLCRRWGCTLTGAGAALMFALFSPGRVRVPVLLTDASEPGNHTGVVDLEADFLQRQAAGSFREAARLCTERIKASADTVRMRRELEMTAGIRSDRIAEMMRKLGTGGTEREIPALAKMMNLAPPDTAVLSNLGNVAETDPQRWPFERVFFYPGVRPWQKLAAGVITVHGNLTVTIQTGDRIC